MSEATKTEYANTGRSLLYRVTHPVGTLGDELKAYSKERKGDQDNQPGVLSRSPSLGRAIYNKYAW